MYQINSGEQGYLDLLQHILDNGTDKGDRTGVGTRSIFGAQLHFNLQEGFPLLTTKKIPPRLVFSELCWLIRGETNIKSLLADDVHIWDEWADENGDLGPIYGKQWRDWGSGLDDEGYSNGISVDQLKNAEKLLKNDPNSRRNVVTAWNPVDNPKMALAPCHALFQFEVHDGKVNCHLYQRSADVFLGVPFNIASYAALTHIMASIVDLEVGDFIITFGDVHIYNNLQVQVYKQLDRTPRELPTLRFDRRIESIDAPLVWQDFIIEGYDPYPAIKGEVAV